MDQRDLGLDPIRLRLPAPFDDFPIGIYHATATTKPSPTTHGLFQRRRESATGDKDFPDTGSADLPCEWIMNAHATNSIYSVHIFTHISPATQINATHNLLAVPTV